VAATIVGWDRADPLLRFVDLTELVVAYLDPPPFTEEEGWTTLIRGAREVAAPPTAGEDGSRTQDGSGAQDGPGAQEGPEAPGAEPQVVPLLQRRDRPEGPVWRFAFHPVRGDLTLRPAFPTLVVNLVDAVRSEDRVALGTELPAGASRDGSDVTVADEPGLYRVEGRTVHASLLDAEATRLPAPGAFAQRAAEPSGETIAVPVEASMQREIAPWLLGLVVALLLLEWWGWTGAARPWIGQVIGGSGDRAAR
jgi:hypothetical protein